MLRPAFRKKLTLLTLASKPEVLGGQCAPDVLQLAVREMLTLLTLL